MTALEWDRISERIYQTGVDRGVLYLHDDLAVPWNGLISVEESSDSEHKSYYLDGVKYLENLTPGDFQGRLKAFTYPDEFDLVNGIATPSPGLSYYEQPPKSFDLSYRTKVGNDVEGTNYGYKIHILYNVIAIPDSKSFDTQQDSDISPVEFSWILSGTPEKIVGFRPTSHISIDSMKIHPDILNLIENTLYGTNTIEPSLPTISVISSMF